MYWSPGDGDDGCDSGDGGGTDGDGWEEDPGSVCSDDQVKLLAPSCSSATALILSCSNTYTTTFGPISARKGKPQEKPPCVS